MQIPTDRSHARTAALFLVMTILVGGCVLPGSQSIGDLIGTFYLALFVHIGFTIYDGRFSALRTATWLVLIGLWIGAEVVAFFGLIIPSGQVAFWLPNLGVVGEALATCFVSESGATGGRCAMWYLLTLIALVSDVAVMHYADWRRRSFLQIVAFLALVLMASVVLDLAFSAVIGNASSHPEEAGSIAFPVLPPWYMLPLYAFLRAIPDKLGGLMVMFGAMLVIMSWPWRRADQLRRSPAGIVWSLLCLALATVWIGLGYLGSRPPDAASIHIAQGLAALYFLFFLILPTVLGKLAAMPAASSQSNDR